MTKEQDELIKNSEELIKNSEELISAPTEGPSLIICDMYNDYKHLFNKEAQEAADKERSKTSIGCVFFGFTVKNENDIPNAAEKLINTINHYAKKGYITKFLVPLSHLKLDSLVDGFAVYSWPIFTKEGSDEVNTNKHDFVYREENLIPAWKSTD